MMDKSLTFTSHLHFEFGDSTLEAEELLLQGSFLSLQGGDLLLDATIFGFLEVKVSFPKSHNIYISSSIRTNSLLRLFFTSAVFIVSTDSRVSFSLRRICTSFLWLFSSFEMFLIWFWVRETYFEGLEFALERSRVGTEAIACIVHQ